MPVMSKASCILQKNFEIVWPQLSRDNKELVVQSLPMLILAYTMPDESAIKSELLSIGLSCDHLRKFTVTLIHTRKSVHILKNAGRCFMMHFR